MIERRAADRPQRVLQAFRQSDEALAAKDDMGVLEARPDEPEARSPILIRLDAGIYRRRYTAAGGTRVRALA